MKGSNNMGKHKTPRLSVPATAEEKARWQDAAERAGKTLAQWLRDLANRKAGAK